MLGRWGIVGGGCFVLLQVVLQPTLAASCHSAVKIIHKHISKLGGVFHRMHLRVSDELFS